MKRILACLMGLLLAVMPVCGLADNAECLTITLDTDESRIAPITALVTQKPTDALNQALAQFLTGFQLSCQYDEQANCVSLCYQGKEIVKMTFAFDDDEMHVASNLFPGYVLESEYPMEENDADLDQLLTNADLSSFEVEFFVRLGALLQGLKVRSEQGSFVGDAYTGGVRRDTYVLDDHDVYLALECLMTTMETNVAYGKVFDELDIDLAEELSTLRALLLDPALANRYDYQLGVVYDQTDRMVGLSLTVLDEGKQISTVSAGFHEDLLHLVWGYGYGEANYYLDVELMTSSNAEAGCDTWMLEIAMLLDQNGLGYAYAAQQESAVLEKHFLTVNQWQENVSETFTGTYNLYKNAGDQPALEVGFAALMQDDSLKSFDVGIHIGSKQSDAAPALSIRGTTEACETVTLSENGMTKLDLDDSSNEKIEALFTVIEKSTMEIAIEFFRMIPPELLQILM